MKKLLLFLFFPVLSCGETTETSGTKPEPLSGEKVYQQNCMICHGEDGRLGSGGAKDLSKSTLSREVSIAIIHDGKGAMTPFGSLLTDEEINNVAAYIEELRTR